RKDTAHPPPALAVLLKLERRLHQVAGHAGGRFDLLACAGIEFLSMPFDQFGLVIESIHLAGAAVHEELHDALDLRPMMEAAVELSPWFGRHSVRKQIMPAKQVGQRNPAQPAAEAPKEFAAG